MHARIVTLFFVLSSYALHGQVAGVVLSAKDRTPIGSVEVFINHTSVATTTDESGNFQLQNIPDGFMELVLFKKGFEIFRSAVTIQGGRSYTLNLSLQPLSKKLGKKASAADLQHFTQLLVGSEPATLENPSDLLLSNEGGQLRFSSTTPIRIKNTRTGVTVHVYVQKTDEKSLFNTPTRFEVLQPMNLVNAASLEKERLSVYHGSLLHWFRSLYTGETLKEGFEMTSQGSTVSPQSMVTVTASTNRARIAIPSPLIIRYTSPDGATHESTISATGPIVIHRDGSIINPQLLSLEGAMKAVPISASMPLDYVFTEGSVEEAIASSVRRSYEKVYVHIDKPYYYPGETIWMKVYAVYMDPREVLERSTVMHIELIDSNKNVVAQRSLRIERQTARGDISLPEGHRPGLYFLRAYTQASLNFGSAHLFVRPIRVLPLHQKALPDRGFFDDVKSPMLQVQMERTTYKPREPITINFQTFDMAGRPLSADLSVSVTDAVQVVPLPDFTTIQTLPIDSTRIPTVRDFTYSVERGASFNGQFVDDKGRPTQAMLGFTRSLEGESILVETDEQGAFVLSGLQHFDTATYFFNSDQGGKYAFGKIKPVALVVPEIELPTGSFEIATVRSESLQRLPSGYQAQRDVRMLQEVEVVGKRIEMQEIDRTRRPFGKGDYVFTSKDFNPNHDNILLTLQGRIPGLSVRQDNGVWSVTLARSSALSFANNTPMTVMIDNVIINGDAFSVLAGINPISVESVEVTTRPTVIYGERSAAGMIAVYMKPGYTAGSKGPNFQEIKIAGFSLPSLFIAPNYADPSTDTSIADYRSLIYWDPAVRPDVETGKASIQFHAADLPGRYRVVIEGLAGNGQVIRAVTYLTVDD